MANLGGHVYLTPAANCYLNIMHGPADGTGGFLTFNANNCYATGGTPPPPPSSSPCDVNGDGAINVADVQMEVNMALGIGSCTNPSGTCTVTAVQRVVNAALGGTCVNP